MVLIEGNTVKIGTTDHAQEALGEIVFVECRALRRVRDWRLLRYG